VDVVDVVLTGEEILVVEIVTSGIRVKLRSLLVPSMIFCSGCTPFVEGGMTTPVLLGPCGIDGVAGPGRTTGNIGRGGRTCVEGVFAHSPNGIPASFAGRGGGGPALGGAGRNDGGDFDGLGLSWFFSGLP
jgi:hypothetical protein